LENEVEKIAPQSPEDPGVDRQAEIESTKGLLDDLQNNLNDANAQLQIADQLIAEIFGPSGINSLEELAISYMEYMETPGNVIEDPEEAEPEVESEPEVVAEDPQAELQEQEEVPQYNNDPQLEKELEEAKQALEQVSKAKTEEEQARFIAELKKEVQDVLELAKNDGVDVTEDQLLDAIGTHPTLAVKDIYKLIKPEPDLADLEAKAIEQFINDKKNNKAQPVEGSSSTTTVVIEKPKSIKDAGKNALELLKKKKML
jgi:hypothetical protein